MFFLIFLMAASFFLLSLGTPSYGQDIYKDDPYYEEAQSIYRKCVSPSGYSATYDCRCVMNEFYKLRHSQGGGRQQIAVISDSLQRCPDKPKIAQKKYLQCIDWASRMRKDSDRFCKCYGGSYATGFAGNPVQNSRYKQALMTQSLLECDVKAPNERSRIRDEARETLEERGLLQRLFPGFYD
ncbi:MAG: hypothetical protein CL565_02275 [Alphaproteobacteria bacterium]|nr:hypothetical protein [Alphaproteobacteria bacterium]